MLSLLQKPSIGWVVAPALFVLATGAVGFLVGGFFQFVLAHLIISHVIGVALVMIVGLARVIMLATGAMMAIGAYGSAVLMLELGIPYLVTLPMVVVAGLAGGVVLAVPSTRFHGHYLAMVTLMFQFLVITSIREMSSLTGGAAGLRVPPLVIFGQVITSDLAFLILISIAGAIAVMTIGILLVGRFGATLRAISASSVGAESFGVNIAHFRIAAFAISSGALAFAGALFGPLARILDPETFGLTHSIIALGYPIVGGMNSIWGGIIGGSALMLLPEALRSFGQYKEFIVATLVVLVMVVFPGGILGLLARLTMPRSKAETELSQTVAQRHVPSASATSVFPEQQHTEPAIIVTRVRKAYDALVAVNDVDLEIRTGMIHGLIGPNGAGKTTLFNMISGFIPVDGGSIRIFGKNVERSPAYTRIRQGVARTFQHVAVFGGLSCLDNVVLGLGQNTVARSIGASLEEVLTTRQFRTSVEQARCALAEVGIEHLRHVPAQNLSLGNQRRLEIARAIVSRPKLLLLDEPVSGVAHDERLRIAALLKRLNQEHRITMLLIEHNIDFVRGLCDTVTVMAAGKIIAAGRPDYVIALPEVRREYFGEIDVSAA